MALCYVADWLSLGDAGSADEGFVIVDDSSDTEDEGEDSSDVSGQGSGNDLLSRSNYSMTHQKKKKYVSSPNQIIRGFGYGKAGY